jgi:hypothetical protein
VQNVIANQSDSLPRILMSGLALFVIEGIKAEHQGNGKPSFS